MEENDINKYITELFKDMYYHEIDQKEKINTRIAIPLGFITILAGLGAYYVSNMGNLKCCYSLYFFFVCLGIYMLSMALSIYYLWRAYSGYEYSYLPYPHSIEANFEYWITYYNENYEKYFKQLDGPSKEALIEEAWDKEIRKLYKDAIEINKASNRKKLEYLRVITYPIMIAFVAGILAYVPFYKALDHSDIKKVEIVNYIKFKERSEGGVIMTEQNNTSENNTTNSNVVPQNNPPVPNPPKLEVIKAHENFELDPNKILKKDE